MNKDTIMFIAVIFSFFFFMGLAILFNLIFRDETYHEKWLKQYLKVNPDYINWLKVADGGKDYKIGLYYLKKIKGKIK